MNHIGSNVQNQETHASSSRRKFMRMLGYAAGAGVATAVAVVPASAALAQESEPAHPFGECNSRSNLERDYDVHMLAHLCMTAELMREWFHVNEAAFKVLSRDLRAELFDFTFEAKTIARSVALSAGITLDEAQIASRVAQFRADAAGGAA